tara:strand:+ start:332 stop:670 length:339 start_codon:yes stop_codon:yes gene_type:complete
MTLNENIISDLIKVGRSFPTNIHELKKQFTDDSINRLHWREWNFFCEKLNNEDLTFLFRGIVQVESKLNWIGGSVAGGVWIYKNIQKRNLDNENELSNWSSANTNNPYLKFN